MPQTLWIDRATGERIGGVSLAERIEAFVLPAYGAESTKFISGEFFISCGLAKSHGGVHQGGKILG